MSIYKAIETKSGLKYWKDNRFIKRDNIPDSILSILKPGENIDDANLPAVLIDTSCVFCGDHAKYNKRINGQTVYICEMDYYDKTTGQMLAQFNARKQESRIATI